MDPAMQTSSQLKKIFDSFDLDKSGYIDIKQLGSVASKLGKQIPAEQLTAIMKKIDANKDGRISFGQLEYWWTKGVEGKMMQLVFLKAKSMKLTNLFKNKTSKLNFSSKGKNPTKPDRFDFRVHFGSFVPDAISIDAGLYSRGQKQAQLRKKIIGLGTNVTQKSFGVIFKFNSKNPSQAKAAIDHAFNSILTNEDLPVKVDSIQKNPYVGVKTFVREKDLIVQLKVQMELENAISPMSSTAQAVIQEIGSDFYSNIDLSFSLNSTFDNFFTDPLLNCLLKGFNFHFQVQANNSALGNIRKMLQDTPKAQIPAPVNLITLIRCARFHLGIRSPEQLNTFLKKLGIQDIVGGLPNFKDFLEEISPTVKKMSQEKTTVFHLLYLFSRYLAKHVENDVQIFILGGSVASGFIRLQGKNASKVHQMLFNQI